MNIGDYIYELGLTLIQFAKNATSFFTAKVDITKLLNILNLINIDTNNFPTELNTLTLIGGFGGILFLTFFIIKIFK